MFSELGSVIVVFAMHSDGMYVLQRHLYRHFKCTFNSVNNMSKCLKKGVGNFNDLFFLHDDVIIGVTTNVMASDEQTSNFFR